MNDLLINRLKLGVLAAVGLGLVGFATVAKADWNPGQPYKMSRVMYPDPNGWDVMFQQPRVLADDWLCTETGPVSDVHLWFSSQHDAPFNITNVHLSIHANVPVGGAETFSHPGDLLWQTDLVPGQFTTRLYDNGSEGWYNPGQSLVVRPDHTNYYQLNVSGITNAFIQQQGTVYWLDVTVGSSVPLGWKTSTNRFGDGAVWGNMPNPIIWNPLNNPDNGQPVDLAFVITPEPGVTMLASLGFLLLLTRWRRH